MRFGISTMDGILPKSLRTRRPHSMLRAIHPPRPVTAGLGSTRRRHALRGVRSRARRRHVGVNGEPTPIPRSESLRRGGYLTSTVAPTSSSVFFMSPASALVTFSFTALGAPSTRSLASFSPRPVSSRTTLMTWIFFSPAALRIKSNSVFSSAAAPAAPPPAAGAATATAAAADTPHFSCSSFESWDASSSVSVSSFSAISSIFAAISPASCECYVVVDYDSVTLLSGALAPRLENPDQLPLGSGQERHQLRSRSLQGPHQLAPQRFLRRQVGQRLQLRGLDQLALDEAHLDGEQRVRLHEVLERLRHRHRILRGEHEPGGSLEVAAQRPQVQILHGQPRQPVLHHLVLGRRRLELLAQIGELADGEPAVLGEHRRLGGPQPLPQGRDAFRLLLSGHSRAPYSAFLNRFATRSGSRWIPGPMVDDSVTDRRYCPLAAAGLARTMASRSARAFATRCGS